MALTPLQRATKFKLNDQTIRHHTDVEKFIEEVILFPGFLYVFFARVIFQTILGVWLHDLLKLQVQVILSYVTFSYDAVDLLLRIPLAAGKLRWVGAFSGGVRRQGACGWPIVHSWRGIRHECY